MNSDALDCPRRRHPRLLLILPAIALLLPIWAVEKPPLLDYPNHLASAYVVAHLSDPASAFHQFYYVDWDLYPNLATYLTLLPLFWLFSPMVAGKLLLSLTVLAVPLASWFFIRKANPSEEWLATWSLLLSYCPFFLYGFLSYQLSVAMAFLTLAVWLGFLSDPRLRAWVLVALLATATYFTHLGGFVVAGLIVTAWGLLARIPLLHLAASLASFVPGALCYMSLPQRAESIGDGRLFRDVPGKFKTLAMPFLGYERAVDVFVCSALALGFLGAILWNRDFRLRWRWLGVSVALLAAYVVLPAQAGTIDTDARVLPFAFVTVLAGLSFGPRGRWLVPLAFLLFIVRLGDVTHHFVTEQKRFAELSHSFNMVRPGSRVLPLIEEADRFSPRSGSHRHFWSYGVIEKDWLVPSLFSRPDVHILRRNNTTYEPWGLGFSYPSLDWERIRKEYDYVWALDVPRFKSELDRLGRIVYRSGALYVVRVERTPPGAP